MKSLRRAWSRLKGAVYNRGREAEVADEFEAHIQIQIDDNIRLGMLPEEARRAALLKFGGVEPTKEAYRDQRGLPFLEMLVKDLNYAARALRKSPSFTSVAILCLALGIGANTAIFSLINAVVLRPLPVEKPEELEHIGLLIGRSPNFSLSYPMFRQLQDRNQVFSGMLARITVPASVVTKQGMDRGVVELVSGNYFSLLGVQLTLGRAFGAEDDQVSGAQPLAVLSYNYWSSKLAADSTVLGKTVRIDDYPFTVIGIAPRNFFGVEVGSTPDAWVPLTMASQAFRLGRTELNDKNYLWLDIVGRRKRELSGAQALAGLEVVFQQVLQADGQPVFLRNVPLRIHLELCDKGLSRLRSTFKNPLLVLMAIVALVLTMACANIANLLLARSSARRREIGVRLALGAGRGRLIRQLLTESALLGLLGGAFGLVFSLLGVQVLLTYLPGGRVPLSLDVPLDVRVVVFVAGVSIVTVVLFGLVPAIQTSRVNLTASLKEMGESLSGGARRFELRRVLLILQAAISMVLLVVAGLFLHSLDNATAVNLGLNTDHVLVGSLNPRMLRYTAEQMNNFYRQLESRLRNVPGVQAVGMSSTRLLSGDINVTALTVAGQPEPSGDRHIGFAWVNAGFFSATGVVLLRGRDFSAQDTMTSQRVAVVSESLVRYFFGQQEPVGRKVRIIGQDFEIIGVTRDAKYRKVIEETPRIAYLSQDQQPPGERTVYLRTVADPQLSVKPFRGEVQALDSSLPLFNIKTLADQKSESLVQERLLAKLSGFFGALALLLASIGLYGVMAYNVVRQTREIGIRMALGASRQALLLMVLRDGLLMVAIGVVAGIPLSLWLSRLVVGLLFGVVAHDPSTLMTSALILMTVAALASYLPARRASRVEPIVALRCE